jgi:hypothetical protein
MFGYMYTDSIVEDFISVFEISSVVLVLVLS